MPNFRQFDSQFGTPLNPGTLRHQITWQRKTEGAQNTYGEPAITWADVVTLRASVRSLAGRELFAAQQKWAEAKYAIEQHYYAGLTPEDRISWYIDGAVKTLDVLDVQDIAGTGRAQNVIAKDHIE
jgi:head-tail adaptor